MPAAIPVIAAVGGLAVSAYGVVQQQKASKRQARAQQAQQTLQTRASRRQAIRQAQVARAQAVASASSVGATGSSASIGGMSSLNSQLGTQLGYSSQMSGLSRDITRAGLDASRAAGLSGLGGTAFKFGVNMGGLDFLKKPEPVRTPDLTQGY